MDKLQRIEKLINFAETGIDESIKKDLLDIISAPEETVAEVKEEVKEEAPVINEASDEPVVEEKSAELTVEERLGNLEVAVMDICKKIEGFCNKNFSDGESKEPKEIKEVEDADEKLDEKLAEIDARIDSIESVIGDALLDKSDEIAEGEEKSISEELGVEKDEPSKEQEKDDPVVTEEIEEEVKEEKPSEESAPVAESDDDEDSVIPAVGTGDFEVVEAVKGPTDEEISANFSNKNVHPDDKISAYGSMMSGLMDKFRMK